MERQNCVTATKVRRNRNVPGPARAHSGIENYPSTTTCELGSGFSRIRNVTFDTRRTLAFVRENIWVHAETGIGNIINWLSWELKITMHTKKNSAIDKGVQCAANRRPSVCCFLPFFKAFPVRQAFRDRPRIRRRLSFRNSQTGIAKSRSHSLLQSVTSHSESDSLSKF